MLRWQRLLITVAMGQFLSLLITGTGITTQYLSRDHDFNFPTFQSTLNYILLAIFGSVLTFMEFRRQKRRESQGKIEDFITRERYETEVSHRCQDAVVDDGACVVESVSDGFGRIPSRSDSKHFTCPYQLKRKWWHYLLVALADVEGNYLVVKAYKYTNITSIMLLDCFSIPSVMCISFFILKTTYRRFHMAGVCLCLGGLGALVYSDYLQQQSHPIGDDPVIGDILCVCGAVLYAVSNVGQEMIVKSTGQTEFYQMLGFWGSLISLIQFFAFESSEFGAAEFSAETAGLVMGFVACLFALYTVTPHLLMRSDATVLNLSLLTSDVWATVFGYFLFDVQLSSLYFIAFFIIVAGIVLFNVGSYRDERDQQHNQSQLEEPLAP